jgi:hypothetical protein
MPRYDVPDAKKHTIAPLHVRNRTGLFIKQNAQPQQLQKNINISHADGRGRIITAKKRFLPGDIIYSEYPIITFSSEENSDKLNIQQYCDHVNEQLVAITASEKDLPDISIDPKLLDVALQFIKEPTHIKNKVLNLYKPSDSDTTRSAYQWFRLGVMLLIDKIKNLLPLTKDIDEHLFTDVILIAYVNAFKSENGGTLYEISCLINHSCKPNCFYVQDKSDNNKITVRASRIIEQDEEINFSYISDTILVLPTQIRRARLQTYHFQCNCVRCSSLDDTRHFKCESCRSYISVDMKCNKCGHKSLAERFLRIENEAKDAILKLDLEYDNLHDDSELLKTLCNYQDLSDLHWCTSKLNEMLHDFYHEDFKSRTQSIDQFSREELSSLCEKMIKHMEKRISYWHFILGNNYTVARCYEVLGDDYAIYSAFCDHEHISEMRMKALQAYKKSFYMFNILMGPTYSDVKTVQVKIHDLEENYTTQSRN